MGFILSADNVVDFLKQHQICPLDFQPTLPIICKDGKNFNLVVRSNNCQSFLVKQSRVDSLEKTSVQRQLVSEWLIQDLINNFKDLDPIKPLVSEVVLFDRVNSVLVSVFYDNYISLDNYYETCQSYNPKIAHMVGANLAQVHRTSYQQPHLKEFLGQYLNLEQTKKPPGFIKKLSSITPGIFSQICPDGLNFYKLYQRFPSLNQAVVELYAHIQPACLVHDDLTLDNFIIDNSFDADLTEIQPEQVKIIDWEFVCWADPAVDLGMLVSQYLAEWLNSLVADPNLELDIILSLATCPLEKITPSLKELLRGYLHIFPEILEYRPDFVSKIVQFAGIGILDRLSYHVEHHYPFDNDAVCKLQVAKNLLCYANKGIKTIFGTTEAELIERYSSEKSSNLKTVA